MSRRDAGHTATRDDGLIRRESNEFDRGLSYFDAIYGFAVTLLIAGVELPPAEAWRGLDSLAEAGLGGQLFKVVLSFVVITVMWRINVRLVGELVALDGRTLTANIVVAGLVILIPFTTDAMSSPAAEEYPLPTVFYAINIAAVSIAQSVMYQLGRSAGLQRHPDPPRVYAWRLFDAAMTPGVFLISVPLAFAFSPGVAQLSWLTLVVLLPVTGRLESRAQAAER